MYLHAQNLSDFHFLGLLYPFLTCLNILNIIHSNNFFLVCYNKSTLTVMQRESNRRCNFNTAYEPIIEKYVFRTAQAALTGALKF